MSGNREVVLNADAAGHGPSLRSAICRQAKAYSRSPDHDLACDTLTGFTDLCLSGGRPNWCGTCLIPCGARSYQAESGVPSYQPRGDTRRAGRHGVDNLCVFIDSADFAKKYGRIPLILQKSPDRRCDLRWRKHCCRHLIEQRLKEVVIRSINHQDIGVRMPKGLGGSEPCKTAADNHDSFHSLPHFVIQSQILLEV